MGIRQISFTTTKTQRDIVSVALDRAKKLAQDCASAARRLHIPERDATTVIGNLAAIRSEFDKALASESGKVKLALDEDVVSVLKMSLGIWASGALKRDKDDKAQYAILTNVSKLQNEAQDLLNELNGQLKLEFEDITTLDSKSGSGDEEEAEGGTTSARGRAK